MVDRFTAFSRHRLSDELIPSDVKMLLPQRDELLRRTEFELNWEEDWTPWLNRSYLTDDDLADPEIMAGIRSMTEVCHLIAFIAADKCDNYIGYWQGPEHQSIGSTPLVIFDSEGQFTLCPGKNFGEALIWWTAENGGDWLELQDWMKSIGLEIVGDTPDSFAPITPVAIEPNEYLDMLLNRSATPEAKIESLKSP